MEERRSASRYNLVLPVEISLALIPTAARSILVRTRDISARGFYFNIAHKVTVGTKFEFSIALPIEITGPIQAYISGAARAVRVEETGESHAGRSGVGALIGKYQIRRVDSVNPKRMRAFGTSVLHNAKMVLEYRYYWRQSPIFVDLLSRTGLGVAPPGSGATPFYFAHIRRFTNSIARYLR